MAICGGPQKKTNLANLKFFGRTSLWRYCLLQVQAEVLDGIQEQLKQIRVYGVEKVITYLSYRGERIPSSEVRTN